MRKNLFVILSVLIAMSILLAACATPTPQTVYVTQEVEKQVIVTQEVEKIVTQEVVKEVAAAGRTEIRWFVGLGTGTDAGQQAIQREVVDEFNASQDKIYLVLEVVPYNSARDALSTEIASGNAPDIVGPVGWAGSNDFYGNWLDLSPMVKETGLDTSIFNPALVAMYQTEEGQVGLPFMVFPGAVYYRPELFDEASLNYPPAKYGEKYKMPDGTEVDWDWTTFIKISKLLTIDKNGNNATEAGFDATQIAQYGYNPQWQDLRVNTAWYGGQEWYKDGKVAFPEAAKAAIQDKFDGMWGKEPWYPTGTAAASNELLAGNVFNSGKAAMAITMAWYTCCVSDLVTAGGTFDFGALPSYNGTVYGRVDADTYRILKTSKHPNEAFDVIVYLVRDAVVKLSKTYGGVPGVTSEQAAWLQAKQEQFPFVKNWDTLMAGLDYPDVPSAEGYVPNSIEFKARYETFRNLIETDGKVDLAAELAKLESDLQVVVDKK